MVVLQEMVTLLSAAVVAFAVFLALEQYPHDVPRQPPRPRAPPPLAGVWQVNDELGRTGQFIAKGKIISAETVFLKDSSDCSTLYATDVCFNAPSHFPRIIFPKSIQRNTIQWHTF